MKLCLNAVLSQATGIDPMVPKNNQTSPGELKSKKNIGGCKFLPTKSPRCVVLWQFFWVFLFSAFLKYF